jgi:hypothetical protein
MHVAYSIISILKYMISFCASGPKKLMLSSGVLYCLLFVELMHDSVWMIGSLQEWKDRKRLQRRVIAGKKVLSEMDQGHVLEGLLSGDKVQKASLAEQIACIDFQLFRHAVHCVSKQIER